MDILFYGCLYPNSLIETIRQKSQKGIQLAANNFQWRLVNGFDSNLEKPVKIITHMSVGSYPFGYKDLFLHKMKFSHATDADDTCLGFFNLTIIKQFLRPFGEMREIKKWIKSGEKKNKLAFFYAYDSKYIRVMRYIKKKHPEITTCISVADLPEYIMDNRKGNSLFGRAWRKLQSHRLEKGKKYIDLYLIVAHLIKDKLKIPEGKYIVIETLVDNDKETEEVDNYESDAGLKTITYTGGLLAAYGLRDLLDAFFMIKDPAYRLIICGNGPLEGEIKSWVQIDERIQFKGVLTPEDAGKECKRATVLVNPVKAADFTKYSFPIKLADYLLAGKPVVGYRLPGVPNEYYQHIFTLKDNSIEALSKKLVEICELPEEVRKNIGNRNREFILSQKNAVFQTKRILNQVKALKKSYNLYGENNAEITR